MINYKNFHLINIYRILNEQNAVSKLISILELVESYLE